ncbi:MAG: flavodoxin family protein [Bacteroidales bacterium]|jgi:multimeric flavodoxin WrbA|nr:flavodoxin family protein [Bacteroidales bacterium]
MQKRDFLKILVPATAVGALLSNRVFGKILIHNSKNQNTQKTNKKSMKIVVLTGSPRKNGNSAYLAEQFIKGAEESGHNVFRFDAAFQKVEGCTACNHCGMDGDCVLKDDFETVRPHIVAADIVVFVSPMYYFGLSAQIKTVIDRFYAINEQIKGKRKKTAFLMTYANATKEDAQPMLLHYRTMANYLGWEDAGTVIASGVWTAGAIRNTNYGEKAYQLGKNI